MRQASSEDDELCPILILRLCRLSRAVRGRPRVVRTGYQVKVISVCLRYNHVKDTLPLTPFLLSSLTRQKSDIKQFILLWDFPPHTLWYCRGEIKGRQAEKSFYSYILTFSTLQGPAALTSHFLTCKFSTASRFLTVKPHQPQVGGEGLAENVSTYILIKIINLDL